MNISISILKLQSSVWYDMIYNIISYHIIPNFAVSWSKLKNSYNTEKKNWELFLKTRDSTGHSVSFPIVVALKTSYFNKRNMKEWFLKIIISIIFHMRWWFSEIILSCFFCWNTMFWELLLSQMTQNVLCYLAF